MRIFLFVAILFSASIAEAHVPVLVSPSNVDDVLQVERPEISRAFYGELRGFPHTFEIRSDVPINLFVHILEPDVEGAHENHAGIIIRERDNGRGVELVERLEPSTVAWEPFYEYAGGDRYLSGPEFESEVREGVYRIEVSNELNEGKYVLVVGKIEDFSDVGYFETIARIFEIKRFFGKAPIAILQSPFLYVPLIVFFILGLLGRWVYKRKYG